MSAPKVHLWRGWNDGGWTSGWFSWCGLEFPSEVLNGAFPHVEDSKRQPVDCVNCLRVYAKAKREQAADAVLAGNAAQDRIDKLVRAQGRRKRRAQR